LEDNKNKFITILITFLIFAGIAFGFRDYAMRHIMVDFDEPKYINLALQYTNAIRAGDFSQFRTITFNAEHPFLAKLVYAVALMPTTPIDRILKKDLDALKPVTVDGRAYVYAARRSSVIIGAITAGLLALLNPFAGFLLAIQTSAIHYTSVVYYEALPALMSTCSVLCYLMWRKKYQVHESPFIRGKVDLWMVASGIFFGWAVAGKYTYGLAGLAILIDYGLLHVIQWKKWIPAIIRIGLWGALAILFFYYSDPMIWDSPRERVMLSLHFHYDYSQSDSVTRYGYPWWQPLAWLVKQDKRYNPAFIFNADAFILGLSALGLPIAFKKYRVMFIWLVMTLAFLLIWDTKWPQYIMMLATPLCLSAGLALQEIIKFLWKKIRKKKDGLTEASF
jgi:hypothetical protein